MSDLYITAPNDSSNTYYVNGLPESQYASMNSKLSASSIMPPPPPFVLPPFPIDDDISKPRKRTRTTPEQLAVLEKSFSYNPSPNSRVREQLSFQLGMSERSIQIWFQNRRAKSKNQAKRSMQIQDKTLYMQQQYAANAASAACQTARGQEQQSATDTNLYNYYYCYYFNQIQQQQLSKVSANITIPLGISNDIVLGDINSNNPTSNDDNSNIIAHSFPIPNNLWLNSASTSIPDLFMSASTSSSSSISENRQKYRKHPSITSSERIRAHSVGPYPYRCRDKFMQQERHSSMGPPASYRHPSSAYNNYNFLTNDSLYSSTIMQETPSSYLASDLSKEIHTLTAQTLQIGTWKRVCDLNCKIDLSTRNLSWCVGDGNQQQNFRMDISLDLVQFIRMAENRLEFSISSPKQIQFYMTDASSSNSKWIQCHDFTQDQQGSSENLHILEGFNLRIEWMEILMQAPELESLLVESPQDGTTNDLLLLQGLHLPAQ